ncbi:ABC transporter ATP-binding protein [Halomonas sp. McH1-25]|uniref:ABC transporter ATP-binding protein n=1 Tax=unclassified Halomonas TaxID=2609666 RepID=UPI001EF5FCE5|nr:MULTISPECIES: ABC transporter ATP-binding protein [unclassified Halomonas]MCG7598514.1 ABC transporter ATP-binding protein [Halomonas sp. McH1-25]MCP1341766.1 ABC transporter ATP-binding protein [Halomonas sp. FL8]MCP1360983.1 ABC transporter ATP-binding protein [Halomonas sp. BBD45]MCP1363778.1 ABC transporter ATP-binding protein [Halomonas sp. BBD48]
MLDVVNLTTHYGPIQALDGVSLSVEHGEIVTLVGSNGAGKTTLLMSICGDPKPTSGTIRFENEEIHSLPTSRIMRTGLAVVPEGRRIFTGMTVEENLAMGGYYRDKHEIARDTDYVLALFPRLKERYHQRGGTMSGGEQQMLAIARALMSRPRLLLLDEPSLGLAPIVIAQIFEIIEKLREEGTTIFLVEQNAHRALSIADRGYVLEHGRVVLADSGKALLANDEVRRAYLGG